ncbi:MAG: hypothetical protein ACK5X3_07270 [Pseudomonadota bacterium]|jgi:hypothetical protein
MNLVKIVTWQCPICGSTYSDEQNAIACSNLEAPAHRFKVGDTVYIKERYPDNPKKPLVSVKISEVYRYYRDDHPDKHVPQYLLEEAVQTGKCHWSGSPQVEYGGGVVEYHPAYEYELYALGDPYRSAIVIEDLVGKEKQGAT